MTVTSENLVQTGLVPQLCTNADRDYSMMRLYEKRQNSAMEHQSVGKEVTIIQTFIWLCVNQGSSEFIPGLFQIYYIRKLEEGP